MTDALAESPLAVDGSSIFVIGSSLTQASLPYQASALRAVGWDEAVVDGHDARGIRTTVLGDLYTGLGAVDVLRTAHGDVTEWIVDLGAHDACAWCPHEHVDVILDMMQAIGEGRLVMWVNVYLPTLPHHQEAWNTALVQAAARWGEHMVVYDWASVAAMNRPWLTGNGAHDPGTGYATRSMFIADAATVLLRERGPAAGRPHPARTGP